MSPWSRQDVGDAQIDDGAVLLHQALLDDRIGVGCLTCLDVGPIHDHRRRCPDVEGAEVVLGVREGLVEADVDVSAGREEERVEDDAAADLPPLVEQFRGSILRRDA
ncbi:hypothetical protein [Bradyrhizobium barranii]